MDIRRQSRDWKPFADSEEYFHLLDIVARSYGTLPSEVAKLNWDDLLLCIQCVRHRGARMDRVMKRHKKSGLQATVSLTDLIDIIG